VDVSGSADHTGRDARPLDHNMALRARLSLICRIRSGSLAPLLAGTLAESREVRSQSICSASPRRSKRTRCSFSHTPASCHSRKRRQQVTPLPQPMSLGSISQGMPLFSTKMMPVRTARSSMRGLPPSGLGGSSGNSGSTISQSSSLTNSLAMFLTYPTSLVLKGSLRLLGQHPGRTPRSGAWTDWSAPGRNPTRAGLWTEEPPSSGWRAASSSYSASISRKPRASR
jgi:hypothetical protein